MADGYGEWIRHPLFGLWTRSCAGVYKHRGTGENGTELRDKLCDRYDRLREKEKGIVLWWPTRRFDAYTPYWGQRLFPSFSRLYIVLLLLYSVPLQYCEVDVFIIYVNFSVGSSGTPVTKARVRTSSGLIRNILFTRISDTLFVRLLHNNRIYWLISFRYKC